MSNSDQLREQRVNMIINTKSKKQEKDLDIALKTLVEELIQKYEQLTLEHSKKIYLIDIVKDLRKSFGEEVEFTYLFDKSYMTPDGGILNIVDNNSNRYPILITEVKVQGTNDKRLQEGKKKQASGNAIERLGKNVIGLRTMLSNEDIFPFVCFGYGWDFNESSSILDRVVTINMFGELNETNLYASDQNGKIKRGSFYFRQNKWSREEMIAIMRDVVMGAIDYYFKKYGKTIFIEKE